LSFGVEAEYQTNNNYVTYNSHISPRAQLKDFSRGAQSPERKCKFFTSLTAAPP
jgi:hypothetical protein